jgi:NADH:ubiquinone oxidoreductase subunit 3 (subunit A)
MDSEDVWDNVTTVIKLLFILGFILCSTLLFINNSFVNQKLPPVKYTTINETNYTCVANITPIDTINGWSWDLSFYKEHWLAYLLAFIAISCMVLFMMGIMFGYIPICGCGKC